MSVLPQGKVPKVEFCEQHVDTWQTNAVAIGTTTTAVTDLTTKTTAARDAFNAQKLAQDAAKSATNTFNMAVEAMTLAAAEIIKQVKVKAGISGNSVYSLANIPAPALPTPCGPLGKPGDFEATLDESGALTIKWKCTNPKSATGTVYQVFRRTTPTGEFTYVGGTGSKFFVDTTIPAGSSQVTYQIQAVRSTSTGPWAQFNVNFGVSTGGGMTMSVTETPATPKIAA
jgi:hypothetical protein